MSNPFQIVLEKANELAAIKAINYEKRRNERCSELAELAAEADRRMDMRFKENRNRK